MPIDIQAIIDNLPASEGRLAEIQEAHWAPGNSEVSQKSQAIGVVAWTIVELVRIHQVPVAEG